MIIKTTEAKKRFKLMLDKKYPDVLIRTHVKMENGSWVIEIGASQSLETQIFNEFERREIYYDLSEMQLKHEPGGEDGEASEHDVKAICEKYKLSDYAVRGIMFEGSVEEWPIPKYELEKKLEAGESENVGK